VPPELSAVPRRTVRPHREHVRRRRPRIIPVLHLHVSHEAPQEWTGAGGCVSTVGGGPLRGGSWGQGSPKPPASPALQCPRIVSTDVNGFICKIGLSREAHDGGSGNRPRWRRVRAESKELRSPAILSYSAKMKTAHAGISKRRPVGGMPNHVPV
jgi:hypothetical protein